MTEPTVAAETCVALGATENQLEISKKTEGYSATRAQ
jgi:hypothetical protein